jgi:two-component system, OmpR family, response regulator VanR
MVMIKNMFLLKEKSVLFVEDDVITRTEIAGMLEVLFAKVYIASNGEEALYIYEDESPDIILSDIKMPKVDGISFIRKVRNDDYKIPVVLMTSFAEQDLLLNAANLSVDGYLVKPVELEKLVFTLCKAAQRVFKNEGLIILGENVFYNSAKKELYHNGKVVVLGIKEQELLVLLLNNRDKTVTKEEIGRELWPLDSVCGSSIKNIVLRLRKKLELDIIISVRGIGYRIDTCVLEE